jgi:excisionase family DNA binding protein
MERMYTVEEAAEQVFHVTAHTVRQWLKDGHLQATKPRGRWLIPESAIKAKLDSGSRKEKA